MRFQLRFHVYYTSLKEVMVLISAFVTKAEQTKTSRRSETNNADQNSLARCFARLFAVVLGCAACAGPHLIQGENFLVPPEPLKCRDNGVGCTDKYQGGRVSLPAARMYAAERARAMLQLSNRETRLRNGADAAALGLSFSALGLSANEAGNRDLLTGMGLGGSAAVLASQRYTNRARQSLMIDGVKTINCVFGATAPYLVDQDFMETLFYSEVSLQRRPSAELSEALSIVIANGEHEVKEKDVPKEDGFVFRLAEARANLQVAAKIYRASPASTNGSSKDVLLAEADVLLIEADQSIDAVNTFYAATQIAGHELWARTNDVILILSNDLVAFQQDPSTLQDAFIAAKAGLPALLESFDGSSLQSALDTLSSREESNKGDEPSITEVEAETKFQTALAELRTTLARAKPYQAEIETAKAASGSVASCKDPTGDDILNVTPQANAITLTAGQSTTFNVQVGPSATLRADETADTANVITVGSPQGGDGGRFTVEVTVSDTVVAQSTAGVVFSTDRSSKAERRTIVVQQKPKPTITLSESKITIPPGRTGTVTVTVSDGSEPTIDKNENAGIEVTGPTPVEGSPNKFTLSFKRASGTRNVDADYNIGIKGRDEDDVEPVELQVILEPEPDAQDQPVGEETQGADASGSEDAPAAEEALASLYPLEQLPDFVRGVELLINEGASARGAAPIAVNGVFGAPTQSALQAYQMMMPTFFSGAEGGRLSTQNIGDFSMVLPKLGLAGSLEINPQWAKLSTSSKQDFAELWENCGVQPLKSETLDAEQRTLVALLQLELVVLGKADPTKIEKLGAPDTETVDALRRRGSSCPEVLHD